MRIYAVYLGDDFLAVGTCKEVSRELGIKPETLISKSTPSYQKRYKTYRRHMIVIKWWEKNKRSKKRGQSKRITK